jgi:DNA replication protein DnaC
MSLQRETRGVLIAYCCRCEKISIILNTNCAREHWQEIFNIDATLTAALLDRSLHHVETIVIEGRSYRTND